MRKLPVALICLATALPVLGEEYVSPADLDEAEREAMVAASNDYTACLHTEAQKLVDRYEDPRQVADEAMQACEPGLAQLGTRLAEQKLDPQFTEGYLRAARQRGVRSVLPAIMESKAGKAARPSASQEPATQP